MKPSTLFKRSRVWATNNLSFWKNQIIKSYRKLYSDQHQLTSTTSSNRYPDIFEAAVKAASSTTDIKILSFGCSTGEECFSLKEYFPGAQILGFDINKQNLKTAIKRNTSHDIRFLYSTPEAIKNNGKYDLIFCLSVLCRWEDTKYVNNCKDLYPFNKYESLVKSLSDELVSGGLLVIFNSNFRFEDTSIFNNFEIVSTPNIADSGFVNKFDSNNNRVEGNHRNCIYRKK